MLPMATLLLLLLASNPSPPYVRGRNGVPTLPAIKDVDTAVENRQPILLTSSPWPASKDLAAWTPASITKLVPELGPVRIGTDASAGAHEFWNVNFGVARDDEASPNGFRPVRLSNELVNATMPTERFWAPRSAESDAVHYYSGSLLEDDGRASVPDLQRGLDELVAILGRDPEGLPRRSQPARHFLKVWLGTEGATTPLHYDTQHNVYAQLSGTKEFWLLPPYAARHDVPLYPSVHPLSHFMRDSGPGSFDRLAAATSVKSATDCWDRESHRGRCMLTFRLEAGDVLYLPPFWLHRATCRSTCVSANVWVSSHAMHRMEDVEAMPLPFESEWALPVRYAAVLAFLRALLRWVHAEEQGRSDEMHRLPPPPPGGVWFPPKALTPVETVSSLLSTRWQRAEDVLLRKRADGPSSAHALAAAAECEPRADEDAAGLDLVKIEEYAQRRAVALGVEEEPVYNEAERSWRGPKLILLHDQLERITHWATGGDTAATHALLRRLKQCVAPTGTAPHDEL